MHFLIDADLPRSVGDVLRRALIEQLPGKLAIVEAGRVRLRS